MHRERPRHSNPERTVPAGPAAPLSAELAAALIRFTQRLATFGLGDPPEAVIGELESKARGRTGA
jgi:hypothetical protein